MNIESKLKELIIKQDDVTHLNESTRELDPATLDYEYTLRAMQTVQRDRDIIIKAIARDWNEMVETLEQSRNLLVEIQHGHFVHLEYIRAVALRMYNCITKARVKGERP